MAKVKSIYVCQNCGAEYGKWQGKCDRCGEWNTLSEEIVATAKGGVRKKTVTQVLSLSEVDSQQLQRVATGMGELDRVLGGGLVKGEIALVIGEPGIGKSTLLTQLAMSLDDVIYVTGEESPSQVKIRVERMADGKKFDSSLKLLPETNVDAVIATVEAEKPKLVIVDSVQTLYTEDLAGLAGSVGQVRESTAKLIRMAKNIGIPVLLVGHVTKTGEVAGPKVLEHMVDAVLELTGDRHHELRLLQAVKNRFGATDEVGVFRMEEKGMTEVSNPSEIFLEEREDGVAGSCVVVVMEGTRPVLVEIQALVVDSELPVPRRVANGIDVRRVQILLGVLQKHARLPVGTKDVFVNVTGGLTVKEPSIDLGVCLAVASSLRGKPLPKNSAAIGEVGLLGEVRSVSYAERRAKEARRLGYTRIYSRDNYRKIKDFFKELKG